MAHLRHPALVLPPFSDCSEAMLEILSPVYLVSAFAPPEVFCSTLLQGKSFQNIVWGLHISLPPVYAFTIAGFLLPFRQRQQYLLACLVSRWLPTLTHVCHLIICSSLLLRCMGGILFFPWMVKVSPARTFHVLFLHPGKLWSPLTHLFPSYCHAHPGWHVSTTDFLLLFRPGHILLLCAPVACGPWGRPSVCCISKFHCWCFDAFLSYSTLDSLSTGTTDLQPKMRTHVNLTKTKCCVPALYFC